MAYSKDQLGRLEALLLRDRERLVRRLRRFDEEVARAAAGDGDFAAFSLHMADEGTDAMEKEKAFLFASEEGRRLQETDAALRRLYGTAGRYGFCLRCENAIGFARLEAVPQAELCIRCQMGVEQGDGHRE
jgi:DnaK suppressor protein